jgi:hypothetical protein
MIVDGAQAGGHLPVDLGTLTDAGPALVQGLPVLRNRGPYLAPLRALELVYGGTGQAK